MRFTNEKTKSTISVASVSKALEPEKRAGFADALNAIRKDGADFKRYSRRSQEIGTVGRYPGLVIQASHEPTSGQRIAMYEVYLFTPRCVVEIEGSVPDTQQGDMTGPLAELKELVDYVASSAKH